MSRNVKHFRRVRAAARSEQWKSAFAQRKSSELSQSLLEGLTLLWPEENGTSRFFTTSYLSPAAKAFLIDALHCETLHTASPQSAPHMWLTCCSNTTVVHNTCPFSLFLWQEGKTAAF